MIFDQEKAAIRLRLEFGHVALLRPEACDGADAILEAGAKLQARCDRQPPPPPAAPRSDDPPRLTEDRADAADQVHREISVGIREPAVPFRGQAPQAFRATDFTRLVIKSDETLGMQFGKVLANADRSDAKGLRHRAGRQRAARLERVEEPAAVIRRHLRPIKKLIAFLISPL